MPATLDPPQLAPQVETLAPDEVAAPEPLTPADHGRLMSLDEFLSALPAEGWACYELARGVVTVSDVPNLPHFWIVDHLMDVLRLYKAQPEKRIKGIGGSGECRIIMESLNSGRHPDIAVYLTSSPSGVTGRNVWRRWVPEIVVEVISDATRAADTTEKPEEYLQFGVREYWLIDPRQNHLRQLTRDSGRWVEQTHDAEAVVTTPLLPGFSLCVAELLAAGDPQ
jgi:Uma2 family endonuclease